MQSFSNYELECEVIAAVIKQPNILDHLQRVIAPRDFEFSTTKAIYQMCLDLYKKDAVTSEAILSRIKMDKQFEEFGGVEAIMRVISNPFASPRLCEEYGEKLRLQAFKRRCLQLSEKVADMVRGEDEETISEYMGKLSTLVDNMETRSKEELVSINDAFDANIQRKRLRDVSKSPKVGISDIDYWMNGIGRNRLIVIAGRPGGGKTAFMLQAMHHIGTQEFGPAIIFTMEMDRDELTDRLIANKIGIPFSKVNRNDLDDSTLDQIEADAPKIGASRLYLDDTPHMDLGHLASVCRAHKRKYGSLGAVAVDYLGLMDNQKRKGETTTEAIGRITRGLKLLARELGCSIFLLCQMNRENERNKGRPVMSDLRDSGNIEQDADMVIFLHKPEEQGEDERYKKIEFVVAKGRQTGTNVIDLTFIGELQRMASPSALSRRYA